MSNFLDEVAEFNVPKNLCKVKTFLENQDPAKLAKEGKSIITDEDLKEAQLMHTAKAVYQAIKPRGFKGSDEGLAKHLKNDCTCREYPIKMPELPTPKGK